MGEKKFSPLYLLSALYIIGVYAFVPLYLLLNHGAAQATSQAEYSANTTDLPLLIPVVLGVLNLIAVLTLGRRASREQLLNCAIAIKYALIPFYIAGGLCIAAALLMMFTPVVIMVFLGPAIAIFFSIAGYVILLGGAPYAVGYLVRAGKEGVHHKALCIVAGILQFIFTADVISMMILALKEKKCVKATIFLLIVLLLAVAALVLFVIVKMVGVVLE